VLIFREKKLTSKKFREKLYIILQYIIIIYSHASCGFATSFYNNLFENFEY